MQKNRQLIVGTFLFSGILGLVIPYLSGISTLLALALAAMLVAIPFFYVLLQDLSVGILLITFLLPFEQIGGIQIAGMNVRLSQLVFLATFSAWFIRGLYKKNLSFKLDGKFLLVIGFFLVSVLSLYNTINLSRSLQILAFIGFTFLVYFFVSSIEITSELMKKIIVTLFVSMVLTSLFGLFQFAGDMIGLPTSITGLEEGYTKAIFGFPRIQSTANEPLNFANYLVLPLSIAFAIFIAKDVKAESEDKLDMKNSSLPILILGGVVMILTFSRGGWGALALAFLIVSLKYLRHLFTFQNILTGVVILAVSVLGIQGIAKATNAPFTLDALISRVNITDFSAQERTRTTNEGLEGWRRHKLIGIGLGAYGPFVARYQNVEPAGGWQTVNNEYAELLIETGIVGLITILLLWGATMVDSFIKIQTIDRGKAVILTGLFAAFCGMLLQYISFSTLYVFHLWFLMGLMNNRYFSVSRK